MILERDSGSKSGLTKKESEIEGNPGVRLKKSGVISAVQYVPPEMANELNQRDGRF